MTPRVVVVTRQTEYDGLLALYGTRGQAEFQLRTRGQSLEDVEHRHLLQAGALKQVLSAVPVEWRRTLVDRRDLDRFLFRPEDMVVAIGQDGLVANVAKYLSGQPVLGVNPDPAAYEGILVRHPPGAAGRLLPELAAGGADVEERVMVMAQVDGVETLLGLNEVFVGHRSHQSARYVLCAGGRSESQSSSGIIVSTGTGATGWARSVARQRPSAPVLPSPSEARLVFFCREPWPSVSTGASIEHGEISAEPLVVRSRMNEGGVIFADGIESDAVDFAWGRTVELTVAPQRLRLVA